MPKRTTRSKTSILLTVAQRRAIAELIPEWEVRLKLDERAQRMIPFLISEAQRIQEVSKNKVEELGIPGKTSPIGYVYDLVSKALHTAKGIDAIPVESRVYQFRIAIEGSRPAIWRRILVKEGSLHQLHLWLQAAMGWKTLGQYRFELNGLYFSHPTVIKEHGNPSYLLDATRNPISRIVPPTGRKTTLQYVYDFADQWSHELQFEECLLANPDADYPLCLEGNLACPPEKIGGIDAYYDCLESMVEPDHPRHNANWDRWKVKFDVNKFDVNVATKQMQKATEE